MDYKPISPTSQQQTDISSGELEEYTVPSYSSWFSWNNIHDVERFSLTEFFNGSSITRSPRIYKEYRDFMIWKYREDPSRKLTFTEVRKSLVGDISVLLKVFTFMQKWGLINFNVSDSDVKRSGSLDGSLASSRDEEEEDNWKGRVEVEEGAPHGVRVVVAPNSTKPIIPPPPLPVMAIDGSCSVGEIGENGFRWPPLASFSDLYSKLSQQDGKKEVLCGSCKEKCDDVHYEYGKDEDLIICEKCFEAGKYGEEKSADDFKVKDHKQVGLWTEEQTLLLLESVLKHGDDWELAVKNVEEKSKEDCILKLVEMPFGDLVLGITPGYSSYLDETGAIGNSVEAASVESVKSKELISEFNSKDQPNEDVTNGSPPLKRMRCDQISVTGSPLMQQVSQICKMLGPNVTASAADAAITALCYENQCSREIFNDDDPPVHSNDEKRAVEGDDQDPLEEEAPPNQSDVCEKSFVKSIIPLNLRTRAATAAALGAAAANAKLLADQEEREIGYLLATMLDDQLKKLQKKMKYFEELESIMETEQAKFEELEETLLSERINILQRIVTAGLNEPSDQNQLK